MDKVVIKSSTKMEMPSDEMLKKAGWSIVASDPKTSITPLADDGKTATDRPSDSTVLEDHGSPVTASTEDSVDTASTIFAALKVAELEEELGLTDDWSGDKISRIAELEDTSLDRLEERITTLGSVKSAGMARKTSTTSASSLKLASLVRKSSNDESVEISDEAILL